MGSPMSHGADVNCGKTCHPPDTAANIGQDVYNPTGMPPSVMMCDDDSALSRNPVQVTAVRTLGQAATSSATLSTLSSMERSPSRASSVSTRIASPAFSPPTTSALDSLGPPSTSHGSAHSPPLSPPTTSEPDRRRTGFRLGKDLLQPGQSPVKRVYHGKSATSPVDLSARAMEIASRKRKMREHETGGEGPSLKRVARVSGDEDEGSDTEHSDQLDQTEANTADPAAVAKVLNALERKRAKNRDSARKSRLAKKETVDRLQLEIDKLKERLRQCETERDFWKAKGEGKLDDVAEPQVDDRPLTDEGTDST